MPNINNNNNIIIIIKRVRL